MIGQTFEVGVASEESGSAVHAGHQRDEPTMKQPDMWLRAAAA